MYLTFVWIRNWVQFFFVPSQLWDKYYLAWTSHEFNLLAPPQKQDYYIVSGVILHFSALCAHENQFTYMQSLPEWEFENIFIVRMQIYSIGVL